ncbi:MAG: sigma-70 family RNA polymerase sigma factor [Bacteroidales bacterium]
MSISVSCYPNEKELVKACLKNKRKAQRELYEKYSSRMFSLCLRYAKDADTAQDYLQEGFITVFTKLKNYSGVGSFEGWMRRIFINTALMELRKNDILNDSEDVDELKTNIPYIENTLDKIQGKEVQKLISQMPIGFRTVFNMNVIDGYSHQEIAEKLNITEGASRSQLSRGRTWLKNRILELQK